MDVLGSHILVVHSNNVSVVSAHVSLFVLVGVLEGLKVVELRGASGSRTGPCVAVRI